MVKIEGNTEDIYWIIMNGDKTIIHYGLVTVGNVVESGLNVSELFTIKDSWLSRLLILGIDLSIDDSDDSDGESEVSDIFEP